MYLGSDVKVYPKGKELKISPPNVKIKYTSSKKLSTGFATATVYLSDMCENMSNIENESELKNRLLWFEFSSWTTLPKEILYGSENQCMMRISNIFTHGG